MTPIDVVASLHTPRPCCIACIACNAGIARNDRIARIAAIARNDCNNCNDEATSAEPRRHCFIRSGNRTAKLYPVDSGTSRPCGFRPRPGQTRFHPPFPCCDTAPCHRAVARTDRHRRCHDEPPRHLLLELQADIAEAAWQCARSTLALFF